MREKKITKNLPCGRLPAALFLEVSLDSITFKSSENIFNLLAFVVLDLVGGEVRCESGNVVGFWHHLECFFACFWHGELGKEILT